MRGVEAALSSFFLHPPPLSLNQDVFFTFGRYNLANMRTDCCCFIHHVSVYYRIESSVISFYCFCQTELTNQTADFISKASFMQNTNRCVLSV